MPGATSVDRIRPARYHRSASRPRSATLAMANSKLLILAAGLAIAATASALCWRSWLADGGDPALTGDPRAYARATGVLMTPAGMLPAAAFSDGPGRIAVADALALAGTTAVAASTRLGQPDARLDGKGGAVLLWWNAVAPEAPDQAQPPAFHLRVDVAADGRITRVACLGARLAEIHTTPR